MLFNSLSFLVFFIIVFSLFWLINSKNNNLKNSILLISSYIFYSSWDIKFLLLLIFSTLLDYYFGLKIFNTTKKKKWLFLSVFINLSVLFIFKYYNFFISNFISLSKRIGFEFNPVFLKIILPIGISFYTFHGLSYVIDIYKKKIKPERNYVNYSLFVSYFPLLVAGPIERASHLLPQLKREKKFNYIFFSNGMKQVLWGLFKKVVIADNCSVFVDQIYNFETSHNGMSLLIATVFFAFQIYCDFSGYSDIALGCSKLFGIELIKNFSYPYFSRDVAEFWRRWHISLTSWFRDYLYIPLGGSSGSLAFTILNTFLIFIVSGFWHGANWTFIFWGGINAIYFIPLLIFKRNRKNLKVVAENRIFPTFSDFFKIIFTFILILFSWIFFRSNNLNMAFRIISKIYNDFFILDPVSPNISIILLIPFMIVVEWSSRRDNFGLEKFGNTWPKILRYSFYYLLILSIFWFSGEQQQFIYFQF
jgi:alginate O-acetyltransferase complex protein AlgI